MTHTIEPIPVDVVAQSFQAERQTSAEFGIWTTYQVPNTLTPGNLASAGSRPSPILVQDEMRYKAVLHVWISGGTNPSPSQPAVPGSTVAQQNTNAYPVNVVISAGTVTAVFVNGIQVGSGDGTYLVPSAGAISITYSVAPTWVWSNASPATGNQLTGYVIIGTLNQIQNGQGGQLHHGVTVALDNQQALYAVSDGVNSATISVLDNRYTHSKPAHETRE